MRYGRQVRLVSQPSHPATRLKQAGTDGADLLDRIRSRRPTAAPGPAAEALRQIMVQHFLVDTRGRLRPRAEKDGLPPTGRRLQSPYDLQARYVRRGHRTWTGYLAHVTETCDAESVNVITDVATTAPTADSTALPGIHARLEQRRLLLLAWVSKRWKSARTRSNSAWTACRSSGLRSSMALTRSARCFRVPEAGWRENNNPRGSACRPYIGFGKR